MTTPVLFGKLSDVFQLYFEEPIETQSIQGLHIVLLDAFSLSGPLWLRQFVDHVIPRLRVTEQE